jgi:dTDP-4-amino-4,6-dideoxygalactose transaminase
MSEIYNNGLFASSHYGSLDGIFSNGCSPVAEKLHSMVINLFNDDNFDTEQAKRIVRIINLLLKKRA